MMVVRSAASARKTRKGKAPLQYENELNAAKYAMRTTYEGGGSSDEDMERYKPEDRPILEEGAPARKV